MSTSVSPTPETYESRLQAFRAHVKAQVVFAAFCFGAAFVTLNATPANSITGWVCWTSLVTFFLNLAILFKLSYDDGTLLLFATSTSNNKRWLEGLMITNVVNDIFGVVVGLGVDMPDIMGTFKVVVYGQVLMKVWDISMNGTLLFARPPPLASPQVAEELIHV